MRFLHDDPNPLNVLEIRELNFCPSSWECVKLETKNSWEINNTIEECRKWIYSNLNGRFCIISDSALVDNKIEIVYKIGFEEASESTMFSLGCSVLHDRHQQTY